MNKSLYLIIISLLALFSCKKDFSELGNNILGGSKFRTGQKELSIKAELEDYENDSLITTLGSNNYIYIGKYRLKNMGELKSSLLSRVIHPETVLFGDEIIDSVRLNMIFLPTENTELRYKYPFDYYAIGSSVSVDIEAYTVKEEIEDTTYGFMDKFTNDQEIFNLKDIELKFDTTWIYTVRDEDDEEKDTIIIDTTFITPRILTKIPTKFWQNLFNTYSGQILNSTRFREDLNGIKINLGINDDKILFFDPEDIFVEVFYRDSRDRKFSYKLSLYSDYTANLYEFAEILGNNPDDLYMVGLDEKQVDLSLDINEIKSIRDSSFLINKAELVIDVSSESEIEALLNNFIIYDSEKDIPIIDFIAYEHYNPKGYLDKISDDEFKYKLNITGHINNLINNDSSNVDLKLRVLSPAQAIGGSIIKKNMKLKIYYSKQ